MKTLSIDIETFSSENLTKCGVYRYAEAPDFEVLLFGYSADGAPVQVVDLTAGETLPADVRSALTDPAVTYYGFGHGVGMSQCGAVGYAAEKGMNYKQILQHYYTGAQIRTRTTRSGGLFGWLSGLFR